ncbi:Histidine protein methyltransferase 1 [Coniosporium apollinis]|uniref:Histidine protein methyltransferase 1 n=1 Tax=Coniosporium apollinis TaxID=61459 RepID=A0ABQ9P4W3_9PEZI|nr:Histidine protein methyltransferase 1 [Coniosporium apollinis]
MAKRTWAQASLPSASGDDDESSLATPTPNALSADTSPAARNRPAPLPRSESAFDGTGSQPNISRKVKACAACRKQKIKCIMSDAGPPCRRCVDRNLSCVLNKSLQTLIDERHQWKGATSRDLVQMHGALQDVLKRLSMPPLPRLEMTSAATEVPSVEDFVDPLEDVGPSTDNSPKVSPKDDSMPHVPIQSLYEITKLRALRSDDAVQESPTSHPNGRASRAINDFISTGSVSLEDAERLFDLYLHRLDHFMYRVGGRYADLSAVRRASPILTACICAVAALHDASSNHLYGTCKREFQRLMAASMFDRRIDRDHLRAMCIGSYWLSDISWTLSGYAIRRATEVNLNANYRRAIAESNEDAADCMRLWYTLYICDQHLSILYGRPSIIREDFSIQGWETLLRALWVTDSDRRLISQAALLIIMRNVQELFGPDTGSPVPSAYAAQIVNFSRQLDQWVGHWSTNIPRVHPCLGGFPIKGVLLHYHFARLHLYSHLFRGLSNAPIPDYFQEGASAAVSAAASIVDLLVTDQDLRDGLVGMPSYLHSMTAFACVFLLKIATKRSGQFIEDATVFDLTTRLVQLLRSASTGQWHLVHLMADGLEKMANSMLQEPQGSSNNTPQNESLTPSAQYSNAQGQNLLQVLEHGEAILGHRSPYNGLVDSDFGLGPSPFPQIDFGNMDFNYAGFGFL